MENVNSKQEQSEITRVIFVMEDQVRRAEELCEVLVERLEPILIQTPPTDNRQQTENATQTSLGGQIVEHVRRLRTALDHLESAKLRLGI